MQQLKIVFAGTPEISKIVLEKILQAGFKIDLVLTQMDRPAGRGKKISMSTVKQFAIEHGIEVFQPLTFKKNPEAIEKLKQLKPDLMIVVAYGLILPKEVLDIPTFGCVNIHVSLLPHLRGAAPIQRAILNGDEKSGVTIMQMDEGLDTGAVILQQSVMIEKKETSGTLHDKLANLGADLIIDYLKQYKDLNKIEQDNSKATYAAKIDKSEAQINWNEEAIIIERKIRGFNPVPGCFTFLEQNRLLIWDADVSEQTTNIQPGTIIGSMDECILVACGKGSILKIKELQLAGRNRQTSTQFKLGHSDLQNKKLG